MTQGPGARIRAVVFDFGGVLLDWNPRHLYRKLFGGDEAAMESFLAEIGFTDWNLAFDRGHPFSVGILELAARFPGYAGLIRAFDERWEETIAGPMADTVALLPRLKAAGYQLCGLSNWSAEKFALARTRYGFFDLLDTILVSGEVQALKPEPRIYGCLLERAGRTAGECVFIDDSEANVAAARELGFSAIRFESARQLARQLAELGLLPVS